MSMGAISSNFGSAVISYMFVPSMIVIDFREKKVADLLCDQKSFANAGRYVSTNLKSSNTIFKHFRRNMFLPSEQTNRSGKSLYLICVASRLVNVTIISPTGKIWRNDPQARLVCGFKVHSDAPYTYHETSFMYIWHGP